MRILAAIVALILIGCATVPRAPAFKPCQDAGKIGFQQCGAPEFDGQAQLYIEIFEEVWSETPWLPQNPARLHAAFQLIDLHWQPWTFSQPDGAGRLWGLTYPIIGGRYTVFCAKTSIKIEQTSLGHELVHIGYGAINGNLMADHFTGTGRWPPSVEEFLRRVGERYRQRLDEQSKTEGLRIQR